MNRLDPAHLRERLQSAGGWSKKSLGQHFLVDQNVLETIVETAQLQPDDTVVEIGPGPGVLTERLLAEVHRVVAFELDPVMQEILRADFANLELYAGDVLQEAPVVINRLDSYKVVANIPYQITTPLIKLFLEGGVERVPESLTLLVQKEVGKRLAAGPAQPDRGYLSVLVQYYTNIRYVLTVPASSFWPAPEVDSAVIHLELRRERPLAADQEKAFFKFVRTFFTERRKQLKNVVAGVRGVSASQVAAGFAKLGIAENARAQELSEAQWLALFNASL